MATNEYLDKAGNLNTAGNKRFKQYVTDTEQHLRQCGQYNGPRLFKSRIILLECGFDELNLSNTTLYVPSYVLFRDAKTGKQYQVRDNGITEYVPHGEIILSTEYWDCECGDKYIHPNSADECPVCGALRDEMPDSRQNEVNEGTHMFTINRGKNVLQINKEATETPGSTYVNGWFHGKLFEFNYYYSTGKAKFGTAPFIGGEFVSCDPLPEGEQNELIAAWLGQ